MKDSINQDLDIFSDKGYWTLARKKLLSIMFKGSSSWNQEELGKRIGKTENTVRRYLKEPTFQLAMARMAETKRLLLLVQILKFRKERWELIRKELKKRLEKGELSFKNVSKLMEGIEKYFLKSPFYYLPENLRKSEKD